MAQAKARVSRLLTHLAPSVNGYSALDVKSPAAAVAPAPTAAAAGAGAAAAAAAAVRAAPTAAAANEEISNGKKEVFRFTHNGNGLLSLEQRRFYEKNGYIIIRKLYPEADMEKYRKRFAAIANGEVERVPSMTMMRDVAIAKKKGMGEMSITKLQDWQDDPILFQYVSDPHIVPYVQAIIGPDIKSIHTMLINKPPDVGLGSSRHPLHQDLWYFPFRPAERICASWTAMQRITRENGCLCVDPGTHTGQLFKHEYPKDGVVNKAYHGIQGMTEADTVSLIHVDMEPGDTIFFHPLLIHGSGRNNSSGYRKAISCHYASTACHFEEMDGTMQQEMAKEIEDIAKVKGLEIGFNDIWRFKSRLIAGKEGTL